MCTSKYMSVYYEKKINRSINLKKKNLFARSCELGFLVYIHIFAACWGSGAVAFADAHMPCYLLLLH